MMVLDGGTIFDRKSLHQQLQTGLSLPDWYGQNLDALYDCLTTLSQDTNLRVIRASCLRKNLGEYTDVFARVLQDSAAENPHLSFFWEE